MRLEITGIAFRKSIREKAVICRRIRCKTNLSICVSPEFNRTPQQGENSSHYFCHGYLSAPWEKDGFQRMKIVGNNTGKVRLFRGFGERLAGATVTLSFGLRNPYHPPFVRNKKTVPSVFFIDLESSEVSHPCIKSVVWSSQEHIKFGVKSPQRSTINRNETGFLHIETRAMYGKKVRVDICKNIDAGNGKIKQVVLKTFPAIQIKDNVAYIPVSMDEIYRTAGGNNITDSLGIVAQVSATDTKPMVSNSIKLLIEKKIRGATQATVQGEKTFQIKEADKGCGGKFCITKDNYKTKNAGKLIQEINIRLAGFGGNVPTEEFTDRTEACIKQFQRDYMKITPTGKICGNLLQAIDKFQKQYIIDFNNVKCHCGKCNGFGKQRNLEEYNNKRIPEKARKYEYPGIHRSLIWAVRGVMFYLQNTNKEANYSVKCIYSAYRCWDDNYQHRRKSTNHMGKALDLHFNKRGQRTSSLQDMEFLRKNIFHKYLNAGWDWRTKDIFNLESTKTGAKTWVHFDVREFSLEYLDKKFFATTMDTVNGISLKDLAEKLSLSETYNCLETLTKQNITMPKFLSGKQKDFTPEDGRKAIEYIYNKYGENIAIIIEKMYRLETTHFTSGQYKKCGTGGMEAHGDAPYYGWDKAFFESHPQYKPIGLYGAYEGKGMSEHGGNIQVKNRPKQFVKLPSVEAGMVYKAEYIIRHNGNYARWYSRDPNAQKIYRQSLSGIKAKFVTKIKNNK